MKRHKLFRDAYCDGTGTMVCHCGGDFCLCGLDGEDCFGCEKCEGGEPDYLDEDPAPAECHTQERSE